MNDRAFTIKKNILDLKHSESLTKGVTNFSLAIGGFVSIIISLCNDSLLVAFVLACIFAGMFIKAGGNQLGNCRKIREEVERLK